jgi:tyrosyl-tRNA synthetase
VNDIWAELNWRGILAESTDADELRSALTGGQLTYYVGFDPTAPSLHHGHLVQLLTARRLQQFGHRPLALVGGSTGLIGDPRASAERSLQSPEVVAGWVDRIRAQIEPFLDFTGPAAARVVNNLDWTAPLSAIDFLRDIGKHFSVNRMLEREVVATRLAGDGMSYTEFSYVLLQSLDFLQLFRSYGCTLQLGGSDQWGNITAGCGLIRRIEGERVHAMATPLLTKADGTKFGKSEGGAIWLDPALTSPYAFHQFFLNSEDAKVIEYLKIMTFRSRDEIDELALATRERPAARAAQRALADDVTTLVHGAAETDRAKQAAAALFGRSELAELDETTLAAALAETPTVQIGAGDQLPDYAELFQRAGLVPSKSAARRAVADGGAYVNNARLDREAADAAPDRSSLLYGRWLVLRRGRRQVAGVDVLPA